MSNKEYRPTLAQMRTFVTIAENRHFGTAASKLHISQPSLSQALVSLENGLGVQLIERSTRKVIVTPVGEALLPYAKRTLDAADTFLAHSRGATGELTGPLTIGVIPTIAPYLLPTLLPKLKEHLPDLEPQFVEDRTQYLLQKLRDGQLDCAILALPTDASGMIEVPLYHEEFQVIVPAGHPFAGRPDLSLKALEKLDLLLLDDTHCLRDQVLDLCRKAKIDPQDSSSAPTRASSLTTIVQLVAAGYGATLIPVSAINAECSSNTLATAAFENGVNAGRHVGLVHRSSSSRTGEFRRFGALTADAFRDVIALSPGDPRRSPIDPAISAINWSIPLPEEDTN